MLSTMTVFGKASFIMEQNYKEGKIEFTATSGSHNFFNVLLPLTKPEFWGKMHLYIHFISTWIYSSIYSSLRGYYSWYFMISKIFVYTWDKLDTWGRLRRLSCYRDTMLPIQTQLIHTFCLAGVLNVSVLLYNSLIQPLSPVSAADTAFI